MVSVETAGDAAWTTRIASVTKLLVAYACLVALEEGTLTLEEPAGPQGSTVRHLLAHASGLPFEGLDPIARPGERRIYSNTGFERLGKRAANRIVAAAHGDLIEAEREPSLPIHATGIVHGRDDATNHRAGRDDHAPILSKIDDGRRFEAILYLTRVGAQRCLQPNVDLGPSRHCSR